MTWSSWLQHCYCINSDYRPVLVDTYLYSMGLLISVPAPWSPKKRNVASQGSAAVRLWRLFLKYCLWWIPISSARKLHRTLVYRFGMNVLCYRNLLHKFTICPLGTGHFMDGTLQCARFNMFQWFYDQHQRVAICEISFCKSNTIFLIIINFKNICVCVFEAIDYWDQFSFIFHSFNTNTSSVAINILPSTLITFQLRKCPLMFQRLIR